MIEPWIREHISPGDALNPMPNTITKVKGNRHTYGSWILENFFLLPRIQENQNAFQSMDWFCLLLKRSNVEIN